MPKPIKSQEAHDRRFNADKENFRQKYGRMSLEEIAECGLLERDIYCCWRK